VNRSPLRSPPRVGILAPAFPPAVGGAETLVATLTLALVRSGCATPVIITANQPTAEITDVVRDGGGDLVVLPNQPRPGRLPWIHDMFHKSEALHDVLQRQALDIVHAFSYDTAITAAITLPQHRPDRVPLVGTFSEITLPERDATEHLRASFAFAQDALDVYAALSQAYADVALAHGLPAQKLHVNRAGVDVDRFSEGCRRRGRAHLGISENAVVITCPSRFKARKGQLELLRAMSALGSLTSHVVLVLAGSINSADKNYLDQIRRAATRIGLGERLHILEDVPRARMPDLLAASDIVAQPSYFEGLGLAALEAMAAGACTILTDTHGFNEIGSHLHTTFYVQPCSTDSLAAGLRVLLENPALRSRLAGEARRHVREHFSISAMAERMAVLYQHAQAHDRARTDRVGVGA